MIVCSCNVISESEIKASLQDEACPRTPAAIYRCLGCSPHCGRCFATVRMIISEALAESVRPAKTSNATCIVGAAALV
ncbi:MAG: bacterioferritin-associated ferredoxin [Beijerinckiaceae bacterium]